MATRKGSKLYYNPETKETKMFPEAPNPPWIKGRPPWQDLSQSPEHVSRRAESMRRRNKENGPTEKEVLGYKKQSQTRRNGNYSPSLEVRQKLREKLLGRDFGWREGRSRAVAVRGGCDIVYILKVTTVDGRVFGKWGSTRETTFKYREREFRRHGFTWEVIYWGWFGERAPDVEAFVGRSLYEDPSPHKDLNFYGKTECFAWTEETLHLLREVTNGMEESTAP